MNMKAKFLSVATLCLFLAMGSTAQTNQQSASSAMMTSMQSGMNKMMALKMTGDPDHDFAAMMRMHHQSAVEMADLQLRQGKNAQVKALAQKIKASNQSEIKQFDRFLNQHKPQSTGSKFGQQGMAAMHSGRHSMNGNVDHDFASMMAQHHQQAIDMAQAYLKEGKDAAMRTLANNIIRQQTKEIAQLKKLETQLAAR